MAGLDLSSLANLNSNLASLLPSQTDVIQSIGTSLAAGVLLSGIKAQMANGTIPDPLHLAATQAGGSPPAPTNNPNLVVGPTITASAYAALPASAQASLVAAGVHIVAG